MEACTTPATITGRPEAPAACQLALPDFGTAAATNNLIFRIPTPVFGAGLIEQIPDSVIEANQSANGFIKKLSAFSGAPTASCREEHHGQHEQQRQRWNDCQVRVEGAEPIPAALLGRGIQRRDGHHQ